MKDLAEEVMQYALDSGADDAIVHVSDTWSSQLRFSQSEIDISKRWRDRTAAVFLAMDGKVSLNSLGDLEAWRGEVDDLVAWLRSSQANPQYAGLPEGPFSYAPSTPDRSIPGLEEPRELVQRALHAAEEAGAGDCAGTLYRSYAESGFASSAGPTGEDASAWIHLSLRAFKEPGGTGHDVQAATRLKELDPEAVGRRAGETAALAVSPTQGKPGAYDAILGPMIFGSLVSQFGAKSSAFSVAASLSFLKGKVGEKVAAEAFSLTDDASLDVKGRRAYDDEGVPAGPTEIVADGILQTHLHNTSTAKADGVETTANAGLIQPLPFVLSVGPGDYSPDEMIEELGDGLFLTNTWYHRYTNYLEGEFSTLPRDAIFVVEGGEITGSVRELRVSDKMIRLFRSIEGISRERRQMDWWLEVAVPTLVPFALVRDVPLTASSL
jgi:PmbA protein